jgi:hypothetical protein
MFMVQLLLPLHDNDHNAFPSALFEEVEREMTHRFGGVTAYVRAPASGAFRNARGRVMQDDVVVVEVMCSELDRAFWREYRERLTGLFEQEELVVRALPFERL